MKSSRRELRHGWSVADPSAGDIDGDGNIDVDADGDDNVNVIDVYVTFKDNLVDFDYDVNNYNIFVFDIYFQITPCRFCIIDVNFQFQFM